MKESMEKACYMLLGKRKTNHLALGTAPCKNSHPDTVVVTPVILSQTKDHMLPTQSFLNNLNKPQYEAEFVCIVGDTNTSFLA